MTKTLRAFNFHQNCLISNLKHAFSSTLVNLSNDVFIYFLLLSLFVCSVYIFLSMIVAVPVTHP